MRLVGVVALLAACLERPVHTCDEWADCGTDGACEPVADACSFPDTTCSSGRRFSELAPGSFGGACVELLDNAGRGDMCAPGENTCASLRECVGGRCVSVDRLSSSAGLITALCANSEPGHFSPVILWGESTTFVQFPPTAVAFNSCVGESGCPEDCAMCTGAGCPAYCQGTNWVRTVSTGTNHFCVDSGETYCYGDNSFLQTGFPTAGPVAFTWVRKHYDVLASGESHTCGRVPGGVNVDCWGDNSHGQLGKPASEPQSDPVLVEPFPTMGNEPIRNVNYLSSSATFSCAATSNRVACWGKTPTLPAGVVDELANAGSITGLDTGEAHACALVDGHAVCWGANDRGQSAPGNAASNVRPTTVLPNITFANIVVGRAHACGRTEAGDIYCWGDDSRDQLGDGVIGPGPVRVGGGLPALGPMAAGSNVTCAVYADDHLRCWGEVLELTIDNVFHRYDDNEFCTPRPGDDDYVQKSSRLGGR